MNLASPQQIVDAAVEYMLDGRDPVTVEDQMLLVNFIAANLDINIASVATPLVVGMFPDLFNLVSDEQVATIVAFQINEKASLS